MSWFAINNSFQLPISSSLNISIQKQHLVNSRFELLKTRQQFCGDILTVFQSHCQTRISYLQTCYHIIFLGFTWHHKCHWESTLNRYTFIRLEKIFTVCVDLVFGNKCVQFREICLLQSSTIINTFWVDPHSELLKKVPVKPTNTKKQEEMT